MNQFFGKFGFIHRRLWRQNGIYRAAVLFGPAPLLGGLLAAAVWGGAQAIGKMTYQPPRWAVPQRTKTWSNEDGKLQTLEPARPLPPPGADGGLIGYEAGWRATTYPISWAFGCWHDLNVIGPGRLTLLVSHPGEQTLMPAHSDDIVRPQRIKP
jgi:hypothetical protein